MSHRIVMGREIIERELLLHASERNLKDATYSLSVGDIIPVNRDHLHVRKSYDEKIVSYFIAPREMIFILSKEEFNLPPTVTALASLRTAFTKKGLLALNIGFVDPFFRGPISTALINFSDRPVNIRIDDKFFRVMFYEHDDASDYRPKKDESISRDEYIRDLERKAYAEFPQTYLKSPILDKDFYVDNFSLMLKYGILHTWMGRIIVISIIISVYGAFPRLVELWELLQPFIK